jgi:hypothetical protein
VNALEKYFAIKGDHLALLRGTQGPNQCFEQIRATVVLEKRAKLDRHTPIASLLPEPGDFLLQHRASEKARGRAHSSRGVEIDPDGRESGKAETGDTLACIHGE